LNKKINVLVVLGTECPICIKYTRTLTDLTRTFPDVAWLGVFNRWEDSLAVGQFVENYKIPFPVVLDPQQVLIQQLDAHVTPEVFVLDQKCRILYRGAIDNWFYELGKRRSVITENFLVDALEATQQGKPLLIKATKPVGCVFN
jgi:peroxiredoxin